MEKNPLYVLLLFTIFLTYKKKKIVEKAVHSGLLDVKIV